MQAFILQHEAIPMDNGRLPIKLFKQDRQKTSIGAPLHWHEQVEFYFITSGRIALLCNGSQSWLSEGDIGFINWCQPHKGMAFGDKTSFYTLQIDLALLDQDLPNDPLFIGQKNKALPAFIKQDTTLFSLFHHLLTEINSQEPGQQYMVKAYLFQLLALLERQASPHKVSSKGDDPASLDYVRQVITYIAKHFHEAISLKTLSHHFGLSTSHLCHIFKNHTGQTIHQYIKEYRCHQGAALIRQGHSLKEASFQVGYGDYNYFSRVFKQVYGLSPRYFKDTLT